MLHELANIFTGAMIAAGLLSEALHEDRSRQCTLAFNGDCERGRQLICAMRELLTRTEQ